MLFDTEWEIAHNIPLGWLLYRSVVWAWFGVVPGNRQQGAQSVYGIIEALCAAKSITVHPRSMMQWQKMEMSFQSVVANRERRSIPQFLPSESGRCLSYVDQQQQLIDMLAARMGSMQRQLQALYSSSSWRYSQVLRSATNISQRIISLLRKIVAAGNPIHAVSKVKDILSQDGWKGIQLRAAYAMHGATDTTLVPVDGFMGDLVEANNYEEWIGRYDTLAPETERLIRARIDSFSLQPLVSIVMPVFNPPVELLEMAIQSVCNQFYPHWELCIADDASTNSEIALLLEKYTQADDRIKVVFRQENGHISQSSNSALELVKGEFVALLDHDDLLPPHALFMVADSINRVPDVQLIYSDEDKIDLQGRRHSPLFKCDWNPDLFLSHNFFHILAYTEPVLLKKSEGFAPVLKEPRTMILPCAAQKRSVWIRSFIYPMFFIIGGRLKGVLRWQQMKNLMH